MILHNLPLLHWRPKLMRNPIPRFFFTHLLHPPSLHPLHPPPPPPHSTTLCTPNVTHPYCSCGVSVPVIKLLSQTWDGVLSAVIYWHLSLAIITGSIGSSVIDCHAAKILPTSSYKFRWEIKEGLAKICSDRN